MKNKFPIFAGLFALSGSYSGLTAQSLQTNILLNEALKKVDTDGEYLQASYVKKDIEKLFSYADDLTKAIALSDTKFSYLENLKTSELLTDLGFGDYIATAKSDKRVHPIWNNKQYTYTAGKFNGINSIFGGTTEKIAVTSFAPETSDLALQMRLDLRKFAPLIEKTAGQLGQTSMMEALLKTERPELAGMTAMEALAKLNIRASLVVDLDEDTQMELPVGSLSTPDVVIRIDNAAWIWELIEEPLMKSSGLPWQKKVTGDVTSLSLPKELEKNFMGYLPVIHVDKKYIWIASKEAFLKKALDEKGEKLKDNRAFKRTIKDMPEGGNWLAYISEDFQSELVKLYRNNEKKWLAKDEDFAILQPLINEVIEDITGSTTPMAAVLDLDEDGILTVINSPFTFKNYIGKMSSHLPALKDVIKENFNKNTAE